MKDGITDLEKKVPSNEEHENFQTFEKIVNRETTKADAPLAIEIKNNIPIYSGQLKLYRLLLLRSHRVSFRSLAWPQLPSNGTSQ